MYALVVLLGHPASRPALPSRPTSLDTRPAPRWVLASASRWRSRCLHAQLVALPRRRAAGWPGRAVRARRARGAPRALLRDGAARLRRRARAVPAVGADDRSSRPRTPARRGRPRRRSSSRSACRAGCSASRRARAAARGRRRARRAAADAPADAGTAGPRSRCSRSSRVFTVLLAWTLSQISPAWATRYLAVAVPPLLSLLAGGLAHARAARRSSGSLLVVVIWAAGRRAAGEEQRARGRARRSRPSLAPGDLVVSTQPEHDPGPAPLPAAGPALRDADRGRSARRRRQRTGATASSGCAARRRSSDLEPLMDGLPPGTRVVLVEPIVVDVDRWRAPWTELIRVRSKEWAQALSNDPTARGDVDPARSSFTPRRPNPVRATVMVKTGLTTGARAALTGARWAAVAGRRRASAGSARRARSPRARACRPSARPARVPIARPSPKPLASPRRGRAGSARRSARARPRARPARRRRPRSRRGRSTAVRDRDRLAGGRVAQRVVDQDPHDAGDAAGSPSAQHGPSASSTASAVPRSCAVQLELGRDRARDLAELDRLRAQRHARRRGG